MTQEEIKKIIKASLAQVDDIPMGQVLPSQWKAPKQYRLDKHMIGEVPLEHLCPNQKTDKVIFHLHGGGYIARYSDIYRDTSLQYSLLADGAEVFSVDYRCAPTSLATTALDDAIAAYNWILERGYSPENIIFIGDSAGGHLALTTCLYLKDHDMPLPKAVIVLSPWGYAEPTPESRRINREKDLILGSQGAESGKQAYDSDYFKNADKKHPYVSPAYGDYEGFPSMLIQAGSYEILLDDSLMIEKRAKKAGVDVQLTIYPEMSHVFQLVLPMLDESKQAMLEIKKFMERAYSRK